MKSPSLCLDGIARILSLDTRVQSNCHYHDKVSYELQDYRGTLMTIPGLTLALLGEGKSKRVNNNTLDCFCAFSYPKYALLSLTNDVCKRFCPEMRVKLSTRVKSVRSTFTTMPGLVLVLCLG